VDDVSEQRTKQQRPASLEARTPAPRQRVRRSVWLRVAAAAAALLVAAAVVAVLLNHSASKDSFRRDFRAEAARLTALGGEVSRTIVTAPGRSDQALARDFESLSTRTHRVATALSALKPPTKARAQFEAMRRSLGIVLSDLDTLAASTKAHDPERAKRATVKLLHDSPPLHLARVRVERAAHITPEPSKP
jgi:hypothetical protein